MIRILLICGVGASSGFLAMNMRGAATARGIDAEIIARGESVVADYIEKTDVLMVGPHMGHVMSSLREASEAWGVPMVVIPKGVYATLDGAEALDLALNVSHGVAPSLKVKADGTNVPEKGKPMKELNVLLVCGSGASSGFMATNINKAAKKRGVPVTVKARSQSEVEAYADQIDCVMVGPHLKYAVPEIEDKVSGHDVKVVLMKKKYYSMLDGEGALDHILSLYDETEA